MKKIAIFVTSAHLLMIFSLLFSPAKKTPHPTKHIAVRTIQHRPKVQMGSGVVAKRAASHARSSPPPASSPLATSPKASSPKPAPAKPKSSTKQPSKTTAVTAATPSSSNTTSNKKPSNSKKPAVVEKNKKSKPKPKTAPPPEVFKEIDEALAKIDEKGYSKPRLKLDVPQIQDSSEMALPFPSEEVGPMGPEETLVSYLHSSLNLPEFGEVKIQVTVNKDGSIDKLVVLEAESKKNKAYLEQHLPLLKLPITLEKEKTFTLTFCNEI